MRNKSKLFVIAVLIVSLIVLSLAACKKTVPEEKFTYQQDGIVYTYEKDLDGFIVTGLAPESDIKELIFIGKVMTDDYTADVIGIAADAFAMSDIRSVNIHSGIKSIGDNAFKHCPELAYVQVEDDAALSVIGDYAFAYCKKLSEVDFGKNSVLASIGCSAFRGDAAVEEILLSDTLTSVGEYCFADCYSLSIRLGGKKSDVDSYISSGSWSSVWNKDGAQDVRYAN